MPSELNLSTLKPAQKRRDRKRVGRGLGSGKGRYSGRGIKGQKSRAGSHKMRAGFEGGQMPIYMRLGKMRGSTSKDAMPIGPFRTVSQGVNVSELERVFDAGTEVTPELLKAKRLIRSIRIDVKILGHGDLTKKLTVSAHGVLEDRAREDRGRRRDDHVAPRRAGPEGEEAAEACRPRRGRAARADRRGNRRRGRRAGGRGWAGGCDWAGRGRGAGGGCRSL